MLMSISVFPLLSLFLRCTEVVSIIVVVIVIVVLPITKLFWHLSAAKDVTVET